MESKKANPISIVALIISILPTFTLIPVLLQITLSDGVRLVWVGFNMICVILGFVLSIIGIRRSERKEYIQKIAMGISGFWMLMVIGILAIALISNMTILG
jgi:hypothetical protein